MIGFRLRTASGLEIQYILKIDWHVRTFISHVRIDFEMEVLVRVTNSK